MSRSRSRLRRLLRGRRPPRPQAVAAIGLALGSDRQRHRRVQVEGQAVERGERPVPQLELELAHRLARGAGRDRPLVERSLGRGVLVDAQLTNRAPNIGDEDRFELLAGQVTRDGAGRRLGEPAEIGRVLLDRPLPFPALGGHGVPGSPQLDRLDAAVPASPDAEADAIPGQGEIGRVEVGGDLVPLLGCRRERGLERGMPLQLRPGCRAEPQLQLHLHRVVGVLVSHSAKRTLSSPPSFIDANRCYRFVTGFARSGSRAWIRKNGPFGLIATERSKPASPHFSVRAAAGRRGHHPRSSRRGCITGALVSLARRARRRSRVHGSSPRPPQPRRPRAASARAPDRAHARRRR